MGAWTFVEPYLEWVLEQAGAQGEAAGATSAAPASAATATA